MNLKKYFDLKAYLAKRKKREERKKRILNAFKTTLGKSTLIAMAQREGLLPYCAEVYRVAGKFVLAIPRIGISGWGMNKKGKRVPNNFTAQESSRREILKLRKLDRKQLRDYLQSIA